MNFSPFATKTTEYSFELFLSNYGYHICFPSLKLQDCRTIVLLKASFSKATMVKRFSAKKKKTRFAKAKSDFPPRKDGTLQPPLGHLGTSLPSPRVCTGKRTDGRTDADVTTKISCIDGLPKSPIHALEGSAIAYRALCYEYGAPLARAAGTRGSSALIIRVHQVIIAPACLPPPPFTSKLNRA